MTPASRVLLFVAALAVTPIALFVIGPPTVRPHVVTSIEQGMKTAKVVIGDDEAEASCFPVQERGGLTAFLTCRHVVEGTPPSAIVLPNGNRFPIIFFEAHPARDVAVIWVRSDPARPVVCLPLAARDTRLGDYVTLAGYPVDRGLWLSQGLVGSRDSDGDIWCSVPIYYGCSGGPVLLNGEVVGIGAGVYVDKYRRQIVSTISMIVPVASFRGWLSEILARDVCAK